MWDQNTAYDEVNRGWDTADPVELAAYVLWKLNRIHPFINGNGRAARAACYFILCLKLGGWVKGDPILPDLLKRDREQYVAALKEVDASLKTGTFSLLPLYNLIVRLLDEQCPDGLKPEPPGHPPEEPHAGAPPAEAAINVAAPAAPDITPQ